MPIGMGRLHGPTLESPGSPSARAARLVAHRMPQLGSEQLILAFDSSALRPQESPYQGAMSRTALAVAKVPGAGQMISLADDAKRDPHHAYLLLGLKGDLAERQRRAQEVSAVADRAADTASHGRVTVALTGLTPIFDDVIAADLRDLRYVEEVTVPAAVLLLVLGLGSVGSALVLLLAAGAGVVVSAGAVAGLAMVTPLDTMVLGVATTIGFALGLDYTLLLLLRYRQARSNGLAPQAAADHARSTAGRAVLWCAAAVIVTNLAMLTVPIEMLRNLALAAGLTTAVNTAAAMTLLPCLLPRCDALLALGRLRRPGQAKRARRDRLAAWARHMMHRPWPYLVGALVVLCLAAAPVGGLRLGLHLDRAALANTTAGAGLALMEQDRLSNITLLALPHAPGTGPVDTRELSGALAADPRIAQATELDNGRDLSAMIIGDRLPVDSPASARLVRDIRSLVAADLPSGQPAFTGGPAATLADFQAEITAAVGQVALLVLGGSFLLMLVLFRSLLLPLKAIAMNVLSTAAAFGLLVRISERPVNFNVPMVAMAIVFGVSLDYEVFLVHRITEHYRATGDSRTAVARGLSETARPITLGAAVTATVFAGLMLTHREDLRETGFLVATAVLMDATLIRMIVVPTFMQLLGHRNWWLPRRMHRLLPPVVPYPTGLPAPGRFADILTTAPPRSPVYAAHHTEQSGRDRAGQGSGDGYGSS